MADLGTAFVQIVPSAQGIEGSISNIISGEAQSAGQSSGQTMGSNLLEGLGAAVTAGASFVIDHIGDIARAAWQTVNEVAQYGDNIDKQSQMLSISTTAYQELDYAARRSGASINTFSRGIRTMTNDLADAQNGVAGATDKWDILGVSITKADGTFKNVEEVMFDTLYALGSMESATQRNALANDIFGRSYVELIPLLNQGGSGIRQLMLESERLGGVMSQDAVNGSAAFQDSMLMLDTAVQGVKNQLAESGLVGAFGGLIEVAANWVAGDHPRLESAFSSLAGTINGVVEGLDGLSYAAETGMSALAEAMDYATGPVKAKVGEFKAQFFADMNELVPGLGDIGSRASQSFRDGFGSQMAFLGNAVGAMTAASRGDWYAYDRYMTNAGYSQYTVQNRASSIASGQVTGFGSAYGAMGSNTQYTYSATPRTTTTLGH